MIELLLPPEKEQILTQENYAKWDFQAKQVLYTPLHWLAYWNDAESIHYILNQVPDKTEQFVKILTQNESKMTPLDIAGKHESHESALVFIDYLQKKFHMIEKLFVSIRINNKASK